MRRPPSRYCYAYAAVGGSPRFPQPAASTGHARLLWMRFAATAWAALALLAGCMRFGYGPDQNRLDGGFDAGMMAHPDASTSPSGTAAVGGSTVSGAGANAGTAGTGRVSAGASGGGRSGSGGMDAGRIPDSGGTDSVTSDSGPVDSGVLDSGVMDSGPVDSGTIDAGTVDTPDPRWTEDCPGLPSVLFCDEFEDGLTKWNYSVINRGTATVSTNFKSKGSYALRADTMASTSNSQSQARQGVKAFGHRKSGDLWARYFYYLPSYVSVTQKFSTAVISEYEEPWLGFSVLIFPDGIGIESLSTSKKVNTTFPRDQWVCIEMHVQIDPLAGTFEFFMNGTHITSLVGMDTLPDQGYTSFELGVHYANFNQAAITTYADDVKLGTVRLGCN
jgi:hypothetical protein